jgi:hypothetical protein
MLPGVATLTDAAAKIGGLDRGRSKGGMPNRSTGVGLAFGFSTSFPSFTMKDKFFVQGTRRLAPSLFYANFQLNQSDSTIKPNDSTIRPILTWQ